MASHSPQVGSTNTNTVNGWLVGQLFTGAGRSTCSWEHRKNPDSWRWWEWSEWSFRHVSFEEGGYVDITWYCQHLPTTYTLPCTLCTSSTARTRCRPLMPQQSLSQWIGSSMVYTVMIGLPESPEREMNWAFSGSMYWLILNFLDWIGWFRRFPNFSGSNHWIYPILFL